MKGASVPQGLGPGFAPSAQVLFGSAAQPSSGFGLLCRGASLIKHRGRYGLAPSPVLLFQKSVEQVDY